MAVAPREAAKYLCKRSGWELTNLSLQKILYISHMWHLGRHGSQLVLGPFEAWDYGPVSPSVYQTVRAFGSEPIANVFRGFRDVDASAEARTMDEVYDIVGGWSPSQLVAFTHRPGGAWDQVYDPARRHNVIPNSAILDEFRRFHG